MNDKFYAGHNMKWMQAFLEAIPENQKYRKSTAACLACCIHHQFVYKKRQTFQLTHRLLASFGVNRKCLKQYLIIFQQAGLIKFNIVMGKAPIITLLLLPTNYYKVTKTTINQYTVQLSHNGQVPVPKRTGHLSQNGQVANQGSQTREPTQQARELTQQAREPIQQVREPTQQAREPTQQADKRTPLVRKEGKESYLPERRNKKLALKRNSGGRDVD